MQNPTITHKIKGEIIYHSSIYIIQNIEENMIVALLCDYVSSTMIRGMKGWCWGLALVAFCKMPKCVNLCYEVGHAGPSSKPKSNHKNPYHDECIQDIYSCPTL